MVSTLEAFTIPAIPKGRQQNSVTSIDSISHVLGGALLGGSSLGGLSGRILGGRLSFSLESVGVMLIG